MSKSAKYLVWRVYWMKNKCLLLSTFCTFQTPLTLLTYSALCNDPRVKCICLQYWTGSIALFFAIFMCAIVTDHIDRRNHLDLPYCFQMFPCRPKIFQYIVSYFWQIVIIVQCVAIYVVAFSRAFTVGCTRWLSEWRLFLCRSPSYEMEQSTSLYNSIIAYGQISIIYINESRALLCSIIVKGRAGDAEEFRGMQSRGIKWRADDPFCG